MAMTMTEAQVIAKRAVDRKKADQALIAEDYNYHLDKIFQDIAAEFRENGKELISLDFSNFEPPIFDSCQEVWSFFDKMTHRLIKHLANLY